MLLTRLNIFERKNLIFICLFYIHIFYSSVEVCFLYISYKLEEVLSVWMNKSSKTS